MTRFIHDRFAKDLNRTYAGTTSVGAIDELPLQKYNIYSGVA